MKKIKIIFVILIFLIFIVLIIGKPVSFAYNNKCSQYIEITVKKGDTLWSIAKKYGSQKQDIRKTIYYIKKTNDFKSSYIYIGQTLKIPVNKMYN
jgi:ABC-type dipeptide/oligopeptide/nickel transport system permease component